MARAQSRPPAEVLESIQSKASSVRDVAAALTERIERFQAYLAKMPGRVETDHYGPHPDAENPQEEAEMSLVLRLHRKGKDWIISCGSHHIQAEAQDPYYSVDFKPLTEASIKFKLAAVKEFPNFLAAIEKSQTKLIENIESVNAEYDEFEATLKNAKEGK